MQIMHGPFVAGRARVGEGFFEPYLTPPDVDSDAEHCQGHQQDDQMKDREIEKQKIEVVKPLVQSIMHHFLLKGAALIPK
jgi:hypothetical protein